MAKLGFADRKTAPPQNITELVGLLAVVMSAALNNEVDLENAKVALNSATRMIDAIQADTRMKAVSVAIGRTVSAGSGWSLIEMEKDANKEGPEIPEIEKKAA